MKTRMKIADRENRSENEAQNSFDSFRTETALGDMTMASSDEKASSSETKYYYVYWLQSGMRCYYGATVNPKRRLRQHNGLITGGSSRTRNRGPWHYHCVIQGFQTWNQALKFEWAIKYYSRRCRSIKSREESLQTLLNKERWTSTSPLSSEVPLTLQYNPIEYGFPPENYGHIKDDAGKKPAKRSGARKTQKARTSNKNKKFKKKLHGVTY